MKKLFRLFRLLGLKKSVFYIYNYITYFLVKYGWQKKTWPCRILGSTMHLDLQHAGISKSLWLTGEREVLDVEVVKKELLPGMNVLEIGANLGYYLLLEAQLIGSNGMIYAFEPDPRNIRILTLNIKENNLERMVKVFPHAVSNQSGEKRFYLSKQTNLNTMVEDHKETKDSIIVKTIAIDNFDKISLPINFIRMDIEGFEVEAVEGMLGLLKRASDIKLLIELHPHLYTVSRNFTKIIEKLFTLGFAPRFVISAGEHAPREITQLGYTPSKIVTEFPFTRGLYEKITHKDFIALLNAPKKVIRSTLFVKE